MTPPKLLIVSNRLPITINRDGETLELSRSSGGLVTALDPLLQQSSGTWIGWTGTEYDTSIAAAVEAANCRYELSPVFLTSEERSNFYIGFCNEIIWPLFHDLQSRCNFSPEYWSAYVQANRKFADEALRAAHRSEDLIWVQDYHLLLTGKMIRERQPDRRLAYFHHIPFPPPDIFEKLPWRKEILAGMLHYDLVGFQTKRDRQNFLSCLRRHDPRIRLRTDADRIRVESPESITLLGVFPIGIDFAEFADGAVEPFVCARAEEIRAGMKASHIILGVDRLDYTKGIPERLKAFSRLLASDPSVHSRVTLLQVVVPSREEIPRYKELKLEVEHLISDINGKFGLPGWVPVQYIRRSLDRPELLAYYRAADIALITPLKDGMNLVCKEYCAANVDSNGVLILSEFAGAAPQLGCGAILVNPYDADAVAEGIKQALLMDPVERTVRMNILRQVVARENVYAWGENFHAAASRPLRRYAASAAGAVMQRRASTD